jgi:hypothetical protein
MLDRLTTNAGARPLQLAFDHALEYIAPPQSRVAGTATLDNLRSGLGVELTSIPPQSSKRAKTASIARPAAASSAGLSVAPFPPHSLPISSPRHGTRTPGPHRRSVRPLGRRFT